MTIKSLYIAALLVTSAGTAWAETLVCEGVLGNSGEAGKSLVRLAPREASGLGVVVDKFGSLWDRAGAGTLNRYAPDGRLLGQFKIPGGAAGAGAQDRIVLVGDLIVLKVGEGLYTLPVPAPDGSDVKNLTIKATRIASNATDGWLAAANGAEVFRVNPATGEKKPVATLDNPVDSLESGPSGIVHTVVRGQVTRLGEQAEGWPKRAPGDRLQWLDGAWWAHAYHGTIYRYDSDLEPSPGVVLGGASGSFIGHLAQNTELNNGRGLAVLRPGVYAVSGWNGILHLLQWQDDSRQFEIVRRIGSVPFCNGIGLDRAGNVWWRSGSWEWTDRPDAPLRHGVNTPEGGVIAQAVMMPNDTMLAVTRLNGKPMFYQGRLNAEVNTNTIQAELSRDIVAAAAYTGDKNERFLLAINGAGQGRRLSINADGRFRSDAGPAALQPATPVKQWTSLAMKDDVTLLGAGDGAIVEFKREGDNWKEVARWSSWGEGATDKFGGPIWIAGDAGRLWISDRNNHRVLCFDIATKKLLATFGTNKGDDLAHLNAPESIAARGTRAVVYDSENQRLVKLGLK